MERNPKAIPCHEAGSTISGLTDVSHLQKLMINDSGFAFDPQSGVTFSINHTGASVIRWLNEGYGPEKVVMRMQDEFGIDEYTASQDFESFVSSLQTNALL